MVNYRYNISFIYSHKKGKGKVKNYTFGPANVTGCIIHSDYVHNNMPIIIMDITIQSSIANMMVDTANMSNDKIILTINKININDEMGIEIPYIKGTFNYYTFESINKKASIELNPEINQNNPDNLMRNIKIGLIMTDMINANNVAVNGIIKGSTMQDTVQYCLNMTGMDSLVEQFEYNEKMRQTIVPPLSTLSKLIKYLNDVAVFYSTSYRFFIDFDTIYLISSAGNAVAKKTETITSVMFDIGDIADKESKKEGMQILSKQKIYYVPVTFQDCQVGDNYITSQQYNSITGIGDNTSGDSSLDLITGDNAIVSTKNIRVNNNNMNMVQNIASGMANSNTIVNLFKVGADNSIFTPNKAYVIKYNNTYDESHNGNYIINTKQEIFTKDGSCFASGVMLSLAKIGS